MSEAKPSAPKVMGPLDERVREFENSFAGKMAKKWENCKQKYGSDERYWSYLTSERKAEFTTEIVILEDECREELVRNPFTTDPIFNNIAESWLGVFDITKKNLNGW